MRKRKRSRTAFSKVNSRCEHRELGAGRVWMERGVQRSGCSTGLLVGACLTDEDCTLFCHGLVDGISHLDSPSRSSSVMSQMQSLSQRTLDMTVSLRFLKHEDCHLKLLTCILSLRPKFAFIIVAECLSLFFFFPMEITSISVSISISKSIYQNLKHYPTQRLWRKRKPWST